MNFKKRKKRFIEKLSGKEFSIKELELCVKKTRYLQGDTDDAAG